VIIDTSAAFALIAREPDTALLGEALASADRRAIGAPTMVELYLVTGGKGGAAMTERADRFVRDFAVEIVPFTAEHARFARDGWLRFGKGRHPAALNLGDCFSYALAKARGEPLLFKGDDFSQTDVIPAIAPHA